MASINSQPLEGIRATSVDAREEIDKGIIPKVMPLSSASLLCRCGTNVRSASVVGMVGAGGFGVILWDIVHGFASR